MQDTMKVFFEGETAVKTRDHFYDVLSEYKPLRNHNIFVKTRPLKKTTMQAQPVINLNFFSPAQREYVIHVSPRSKIDPAVRTSSMPSDVLRGWFAHELGHVMDYLQRSWSQLIRFGLDYSFSNSARIGMEKAADIYAIRYGFGKEIKATKDFILNHADVDERYKEQINKYYLSPAEIEELLLRVEEEDKAPSELLLK